jgi:hypothetical protein
MAVKYRATFGEFMNATIGKESDTMNHTLGSRVVLLVIVVFSLGTSFGQV